MGSESVLPVKDVLDVNHCVEKMLLSRAGCSSHIARDCY